MRTLTARSEAEQERIGAALASAGAAGLILFLEGDLGAGKTTLVRGFLRALGQRGPVKSPTYTLIEPYELGGRRCYHLDLYRLADPEELEYVGVRDLLGEPCTLLVEWPERGAGMLPPPDLRVRIETVPEGRLLRLQGLSETGRAVVGGLAVEAGPR